MKKNNKGEQNIYFFIFVYLYQRGSLLFNSLRDTRSKVI